MDYVVWLDSELAHLFALKETGVEKSQIKKHSVDHHTHSAKDQTKDSDLEHYFRDLATALKDAAQVLILGPGLAKDHFQTHLKTHHTAGLGKKIIGVESSDHPTDNQILATARKFYTHYNLFNNPVHSK